MAKLKPGGIVPAVILINPKYPHNVGAALRACSCFGAKQLLYTGHRIDAELGAKRRLPREERMKAYQDVSFGACDYPFERFQPGTVFVAVELSPSAESLVHFIHGQDMVYVFGPEDGSIPQVVRHHCARFVVIPAAHCLNLSAAVYVVLADRAAKRELLGLGPEFDPDAERRGFIDNDTVPEELLR